MRARLIRAGVVVVAAIGVGWFILQLGDQVDWSEVGEALDRLAWWQIAVLMALLLLRQIVNAVPISRFVAGLSRARAVINDLTACVTATIAPPPGDVVVRVAMFRSWGVDPVDGMVGVTLVSFVFYAARFLAPILGATLIAIQGAHSGHWTIAVVSGSIAALILTAMLLAARSHGWVVLIGRAAARVATKVRATVDEEAWVASAVSFRERSARSLRTHLLPALMAMIVSIVMEGVLLLASMRFVGVDAQTLSALQIVGGFLVVYPLTMLPMFGLGVLDILLISGWAASIGEEHEATLLAGMMVWRAISIGGVLILGAGTTAWWRRWVVRQGA